MVSAAIGPGPESSGSAVPTLATATAAAAIVVAAASLLLLLLLSYCIFIYFAPLQEDST